jgi:hypothetical protein
LALFQVVKELKFLILSIGLTHLFGELQLFGGLASTGGEMSKNALRNKKRREKQKEKKAAEGSGASADDN